MEDGEEKLWSEWLGMEEERGEGRQKVGDMDWKTAKKSYGMGE